MIQMDIFKNATEVFQFILKYHNMRILEIEMDRMEKSDFKNDRINSPFLVGDLNINHIP